MTHPIEIESYRRLEELIDLSALDAAMKAVVSRAIHATADLDYAKTIIGNETAIRMGAEAIASGATIITDVEMTKAGLSMSLKSRALCYLDQARAETAKGGQLDAAGADCKAWAQLAGKTKTLSALAMSLAIAAHPNDSIFVVGCAPTALEELLAAVKLGRANPAFIVGLPVGFVGASEAKELLAASHIPHVTNRGTKGGSAVAAAVLNSIANLMLGKPTNLNNNFRLKT